jgi:hypothetical protein
MTELSSELLHLEMHERQNVLRDRARRETAGVVRDRERRRLLPLWTSRHR